MLNLTNSISPHSAAYLFLSKENPGRVPGLGTLAGLAQDEKPLVRGRDAGEGGGGAGKPPPLQPLSCRRVQAYQTEEARQSAKRRVIIIRSRGEYLGSVEAPDRERAEAVAIKQFALDDDQRSRLLIRERL
jgi:hypothetical protein